MGKKATIAGIVFGIIGLIATASLFSVSTDISNQRVQEAHQTVLEADQNLDTAIRHDVEQCLASPTTHCDNYLLQIEDTCKGETYKNVPACHDNTISDYLTVRGIDNQNVVNETNLNTSSRSVIPPTSMSQENKSRSGTSQMDSVNLEVLNSCSTLLQSINDARQTLAGGAPLSALVNSPDMAYNQPINDSQDSLKSCKDGISTIQQQCIQYPSMSVCKDPRLEQLSDTIKQFIYTP